MNLRNKDKYGNKKVNAAVSKVIKDGNLSTLISYDEVNLASELIKINKWVTRSTTTSL